MKIKIIYFLTVLAFFAFSRTIAQEIPEPDFSMKPYYLNNGKLDELEKVETTLEAKAKGMGYGGVEMSFSAEGIKSPVRFTTGSNPIIIIKNESSGDPSEEFSILLAEIKKTKRKFVTGKMGTVIGSNNTNQKRVQVSAKKIRDKVFEITFLQPLQPGEYAIIPSQKNMNMTAGSQTIKMNCFGID